MLEKKRETQGFRKRGKKAKAERNKKNKGATKKRPARSSDTTNPNWQRIFEDECDEVGLQHPEVSESECAVCLVNGKKMTQRNG